MSVPAVRPVPRCEKTGDVRGADDHFIGNQGGSRLYPVSDSGHWCCGNMGISAYWLVFGGLYRVCVLLDEAQGHIGAGWKLR